MGVVRQARQAAAIAVALGSGIAAATTALAAKLGDAEPSIFFRGRFGPIVVFLTKDAQGEPIRVASVKGAWQTVSYLGEKSDELAVAYYRAIDDVYRLGLADVEAPHVAMIGGGGCAWPRHGVAEDPRLVCEVVEADPAMVEMARRWFGLEEAQERAGLDGRGRPRLTVTVDDGRHFFEQRLLAGDGEPFHMVVNDAFGGRRAADELLSPYGLAVTKASMAPGGLYVLNAVVPGDDPGALLAIYDRLRSVFSHVAVVDAVDRNLSSMDNHLFVAADRDLDFLPETEL